MTDAVWGGGDGFGSDGDEFAGVPRRTNFPMPPPLRPYRPSYDRYGRYMVPDPDGGEHTRAFTRATTVAKSLDDTTNLEKWRLRNVLRGLAEYQPLRDKLTSLDWSVLDYDRKALDSQIDKIVDRAIEAVGAADAAPGGTAVHDWAWAVEIKRVRIEDVPDVIRPHVIAFLRALNSENYTTPDGMYERIVYNPVTKSVGTLDRIWQLPDGTWIIGDIKGLALDTPLPTPNGWTTMRDVQVGDKVFGPDGKPTQVTVKSEPKRIGTYVVTFDDGSRITCDSEHIWWTDDSAKYGKPPTAKSIQQVKDTLVQYGRKAHRVPVAQPLDLTEAKLPVEPYLLGAWLGDGTASGGRITKGADLFDILTADGNRLGAPQKNHSPKVVTRTVLGLKVALRETGLLDNKHIPPEYLRASIAQRTLLLQGLMDTDGTWNTARGRACFTTTDPALADSVVELLRSLGQRPHLASVVTTGFGKQVTALFVEFNPVGITPFRLPRKAEKACIAAPNFRSTRRVIVSVEPGPDVETACIAVDNETHVYLAGKEMIPTHNTSSNIDFSWLGIGAQLSQYAHATHMLTEDGTRWEPMPAVRKDFAMVASVPLVSKDHQRRGVFCDMIPVNLENAEVIMRTSAQVRAMRSEVRTAIPMAPIRDAGDGSTAKQSGSAWGDTGSEDSSTGTGSRQSAPPVGGAKPAKPVAEVICEKIDQATSRAELDAIYHKYQPLWRSEYTERGKKRIEELSG